jgi:addiction module HigA family antidote
MATTKMEPIHPGEILLEDFLKPMEITPYRLSKDTGIPATRISQILKGKRSITADTALRLSRYFGNSADFWMGIQMHYDLEVAEDRLRERIDSDVRPLRTATNE